MNAIEQFTHAEGLRSGLTTNPSGGDVPAAPKELSRRSETFLVFTQSRACVFCRRPPPSDPHHYPPRGRLGVTDDSRVAPACRECHERCHGIRIGGKDPISEEAQQRAVEENQLAFFRYATPEQWCAYGQERAARFEYPAVEF
jgi:hypothetical protein